MPKLVLVQGTASSFYSMLAVIGGERALSIQASVSTQGYVTIYTTEKSLYWYGTSKDVQLNIFDEKYHYIGIG